MPEVTVAIPVRNGGGVFRDVLAALARQTVAHELLVCDSGSRDGSLEAAQAHGARILQIVPGDFNHGTTRNLLMREASGRHVALLTQDAEPTHEHWLTRLLEGFALAADVGLTYGPYRPRPDAQPGVRLELERWFRSLSPDGGTQLERLEPDERGLPAVALLGRRGFFTDANACIARDAWLEVPFRPVSSAEDRALALDMLRAGYAKVFAPGATVLHSHDYGPIEQLRRSFDEGRGLREVYGWREPASPLHVTRQLRGELGAARRELRAERSSVARGRGGPAAATQRGGGAAAVTGPSDVATLAHLAGRHLARLTGATLGSRSDRLPRWARRRLSLERRDSFVPLEPDQPPAADSRIQDPTR